MNLRYEQLNKAVNDSLTIPGLTREVPEGNCDPTSTIEAPFKLIVQDNDAFCQDMVGLIPRYFDALTAEYQLKARSHQYTRPERANPDAGHRDEGQQDADTDRRTREMAELTAALRLSTAPREQKRADEHSSPNQVGKEIALSMMEALRSLSGDASGSAAGKASGGTMITTLMKHLNLNKMDEHDAEGWQGEQHSIQVVTNIGQEKGQIVKGIIKAVHILKHFVISREPTTPSESSVYAGRASQAEYLVDRLVFTNQTEGETATAAAS
jgi:hypothetical protein